MSKKLNKIFVSNLEHLLLLKALHESNLEQLLLFRALHESNLEQLLVFKAPREYNPRVEHLPCMDDPRVQSKTSPYFKGSTSPVHESGPQVSPQVGSTSQSTSPIRNNSLFLRLHAGTIHDAKYLPRVNDPQVQSDTSPCF